MTSTLTSRASVLTDRPVPCMRQLCQHFGHGVDAALNEDSGHIQFDFGRCELPAAPGVLELTVSADDETGRQHATSVIGSLLERFGRRDGLTVAWT